MGNWVVRVRLQSRNSGFKAAGREILELCGLLSGETMKKVLRAACLCCGGDIQVEWDDPQSKEFALAADVCPSCWKANCTGISLVADDRHCNVLGGPSKSLPKPQSAQQTAAPDRPSAALIEGESQESGGRRALPICRIGRYHVAR